MANFDVDTLVAHQKFGTFNAALMLWSFLALISDGYEITVLPFAAPSLAHDWHLSATLLGRLIGVSIFGILIGAPLFGYLGDRLGRKAAIVISVGLYGACALAIAYCSHPEPIFVLRFLTGLGIGGALPNVVSLNLEASPRRLAAMIVILVAIGVTLGSFLPGAVAAILVPTLGWPILFKIGGILALVIAGALLVMLPESLKQVTLRETTGAKAVGLARRMRPDLIIPDDASFVRSLVPPTGTDIALSRLFSRGLAPFTLLIWLSFTMGLLVNYSLTSWMPLLFERAGAAARAASVVSSMFQIGGVMGSVVMSFLVGRHGFLAIAAGAALACPTIAAIGLSGTSPSALMWLVAFAGFFVLGIQGANNAMAGLIYPTAIRSTGVGLALGVGRIGSLAGPLLGGMLVDLNWPLSRLFLICAVPMGILAITSLALAGMSRRRVGGIPLAEP